LGLSGLAAKANPKTAPASPPTSPARPSNTQSYVSRSMIRGEEVSTKKLLSEYPLNLMGSYVILKMAINPIHAIGMSRI
jgi:hypothetical protein